MTFTLEEVMTFAGFSAAEIETCKKGTLVKGVLDSLSDRELAVKFGFKVEGADLTKVQSAFMESTYKTEDKAVYEVGKLMEGDEATLFADMKLEPGAAAALKLYHKAAPGDDLNLSSEEIAEFQKLGSKATQDQVEALLRQQLTKRYKAYRELGMKGIAPYQRSKSKSYSAGEELEHKTAESKFIQKNIPDFYKYVLEYPHAPKPEGCEESFSWTVSLFDDIPTVALVHKVGYLMNDKYVYLQRMFYVSRSHNSVQVRYILCSSVRIVIIIIRMKACVQEPAIGSVLCVCVCFSPFFSWRVPAAGSWRGFSLWRRCHSCLCHSYFHR